MMFTDNLVYLPIASIIGWSCTPACFQVVTRAFSYEVQHQDHCVRVDDLTFTLNMLVTV